MTMLTSLRPPSGPSPVCTSFRMRYSTGSEVFSFCFRGSGTRLDSGGRGRRGSTTRRFGAGRFSLEIERGWGTGACSVFSAHPKACYPGAQHAVHPSRKKPHMEAMVGGVAGCVLICNSTLLVRTSVIYLGWCANYAIHFMLPKAL